jgi:hypothetical protein
MNLEARARRAWRTVRTATLLSWRALNNEPRERPSLIVIGAMRSGTSSMFKAFAAHPNVLGSLRKEVHYFDANWHRPPDWYWRHFATVSEARGRITCEATPSYLFHPAAAERMQGLLPDVKLVVLLRHPVYRTISHYFHQHSRGEELRDLRSALWAPESDLSPVEAAARNGGELPVKFRARAYVARSRYAPQLRRWFDRYGRDRFLIMVSEEYFADPAAGLARVVDFAGLPALAPGPSRVYNAGGARDAYDPSIAAELWEGFRESIAELEDLLGYRLPWEAPKTPARPGG